MTHRDLGLTVAGLESDGELERRSARSGHIDLIGPILAREDPERVPTIVSDAVVADTALGRKRHLRHRARVRTEDGADTVWPVRAHKHRAGVPLDGNAVSVRLRRA